MSDVFEKVRENSPRVAVIIPVFNVGNYLAECLDSFLSQTYEHFDLYVIDDGSTDSSGEVLDCYKERDSRIHAIHKKNEGVSSARNAGLEAVFQDNKADYVCFIDGDDKVSETFLSDMIEVMASAQVPYGFCLYQEFGKKGFISFAGSSLQGYPDLKVLKDQDEIAASYFLTEQWQGKTGLNRFLNNKVFHRDLLKNCRFKSDLPNAQDMEFFLQLLPKIQSAVFVGKELFYYRRRKSSSSLREKYLKECRYRIFSAKMDELDRYPRVARVAIQNEYIKSVYELFRYALAFDDVRWLETLRPIIRSLVFRKWAYPLSFKVRKRLMSLVLPLSWQKKMAQRLAFKQSSQIKQQDYFA